MRRFLVGSLLLLLGAMTPAAAQLSINFAGPGVQIGINVPVYPTLQRIPGYPVYYAPGIDTNYFFYDGLYWVFDGQSWYESSWYNGPWYLVDPFDVPLFLLRVPVRYYHHAPAYFRGWAADAPPRWGDHWGRSWETRRSGWDRWNHASVPAPAPLPTYQRQYSGSRYPHQVAQQAAIQTRSYRYQPTESVAREHFQQQRTQASSAPQARSSASAPPRNERASHPQAAAPRAEAVPQKAPPAQQGAERVQPSQQHQRTPPQRQEHGQQAQRQQQPERAPQARQQGEQHAPQAARSAEPQRAEPQRAERPAQQAKPRENAEHKGGEEEHGKGRDKES